MAKFILLYNGPATDPLSMSEAKRNGIMEEWRAWITASGPAVLDVGSPMMNGRNIVDDGTISDSLELKGYTIIEASDLDSAHQIAASHPFLSDKTGNFSIEIFELLPTPL